MSFIIVLLLITAAFGDEKLCLNNGLIGPVGDKCYHFISALQNFKDARTVCGMFNSQPVSITSGLESNFVLENAHQRVPGEYWIGLTDLYNTNEWIWMDGKNLSYTNWATGFPKNDSTRNCVVAQWSGKWTSENCSSYSAYFVCESTPPLEDARCMPPSVEGINGCYIINIVPEKYKDAEVICGEFGGNLVEAVNKNEAQNIMAIAEERFYNTDYWIGVSDPYDTGVWEYVDGTPVNFTHWAVGYPELDGKSFCVAARLEDAKWYNVECNLKKVSICQQQFWEGTSNPWTYWHRTDSYYKAFRDVNGSSFDVHEQHCISLGAHLASIHSIEENLFVAGLSMRGTYECMHIGAKLVNGKLIWTDGSAFDYQYWYPGQYGNLTAKEPCAVISYLDPNFIQWGNHPCNQPDACFLSYACKRPRLSL